MIAVVENLTAVFIVRLNILVVKVMISFSVIRAAMVRLAVSVRNAALARKRLGT